MPDNVIAIDGPAASGKSTVAGRIAESLSIPYINTGNMYRAVTWFILDQGLNPESDGLNIQEILSRLELDYRRNSDRQYQLFINGFPAGNEIRDPDVTRYVSPVSAIPEVRYWLVERQQAYSSFGLIVMEGRDIGTVVFPGAKYKFFLTATPEVRARRRLAQDGETAAGSTVDSVAREIARRDKMDSNRVVAPLRKADDAIYIDSSDMTIEEVVDFIVSRMKV